MGRGLAGAVIAVIGAVYCAQGAVAAEGDTEFANTRHVYLRGESCELILHAGDADRVVFDASGWLDATCVVRDGVCRYTVDTSLLRSGDYTVRARLLRGDEAIGVARFPLTIAPAYDTERLPVWRWGGGSEPEWWMTHGFTGGFTGSVRDPYDPDSDRAASIAKSLDDAARVGFELGFYMRSISAAIIEEDEATRGLLPDGTRSKKICPLEPAVVDHAKRVTDSWLAAYGSHPGLRHVMLNSEVQPPFCVNDVAVRAAQEEIGLDARKFVNDKGWVVGQGSHAPKNGILEDANDRYRFLQWWWQRGHGTAPMQEAQNAIIKRHDPDLITWHEPYRLAPVRGSHKGLDLIATWTYGHPDIKRLCYTTYMQAAARPEGQLVQQDITLFVYGRFAIPLDESTADLSADFAGKDPYFTAGPDYAREAMWLVLSQRPDVLCFYSAGRLSPDRPGQDPYYASPATFEAIREMGDSLVKPYGPLIKACRRAEARVAVLMSAASTWFSSSARLAGYDNEQTLPFASLLMMNHVPFEVVLDDDIAEGALERYDVLVMPRADALTRTMYDRIVAFASGGGTVIADASLRADIPGATVTSFDFTHQKKVDGRMLAKGEAVTAEEDRAIMEGYAAELATLLTDVPRYATADTPRVLTNALSGGMARYHFLVNDDRTYGTRFGEWKLRFELGVPQTAKASVAIDGRPALYDTLLRTRVEYEEQDGRAVFDVRLPAARGMLVAALPEAVGEVVVTVPAAAKVGDPVVVRVEVRGESGNVLPCTLPIEIDAIDPLGRETEWHRYTTAEDGVREYTFVPALNDALGEWRIRVTDLVAGLVGEASVAVAE